MGFLQFLCVFCFPAFTVSLTSLNCRRPRLEPDRPLSPRNRTRTQPHPRKYQRVFSAHFQPLQRYVFHLLRYINFFAYALTRILPCATTGQTTGYNHEARDRDMPFTAKDEPATMPRVGELIIITEYSPWCTVVRNPQGVTLGDVTETLFKECVRSSLLILESER